jgi:23S rRNA (adenine2503-C2)-methyltransferase
MNSTIFANHTPEDLAAALCANGLRPMQAQRATKHLLREHLVAGASFDDALAGLSKPAKAAAEALSLRSLELEVVHTAHANDGTRRLLLRCDDGAVIETVVIVASQDPATSGTPRTTVCVSSQVGCGRGCVFCETGKLGLLRQLQPAEIVNQLREAWRSWQTRPAGAAPITNVVFMGMGEPLDNLDNVLVAIELMTHDHAFGLSARRITVSTVGVAAKIPAFLSRSKANLAISLNAPDDQRRARMMPVGKRTTMADIRSALLENLPANRDVLFEYILFDGVNDAPEDAALLVSWFEGLRARCNLIPANPGPDPALRQPSPARVLAFQRQLLDAGVRTMVRYPHGRDVGGACGQLAGAARDLRAAGGA